MATHTDTLRIEQGSDFSHEFPAPGEGGQPRNLVGWRVEAVVRHSPDTGDIVARLPAVTAVGKVAVAVPGHMSAKWAWRKSRYELRLISPTGQWERFAAGRVVVDPSLIP